MNACNWAVVLLKSSMSGFLRGSMETLMLDLPRVGLYVLDDVRRVRRTSSVFDGEAESPNQVSTRPDPPLVGVGAVGLGDDNVDGPDGKVAHGASRV